VGNLDNKMGESEVRALFEKYGELADV